MIPGVSIVICTRNGAGLLPETLARVKGQKVARTIAWEVLVVDNASTDGTGEAARRCWGENGPAPLRVVHESQPGATFARERGFIEAKYDAVSFVDDDNWICETWVERVAQVMALYPKVGAFGAFSTAATEQPPPSWFEYYKKFYAIGPGETAGGDVTETLGMLWTAGMTVRKKAWQSWRDRGFTFVTQAWGEDPEICLSLRLDGWRLWIDPDLRFEHFLPARRLEWRSFLTLQRSREMALVDVDPYLFELHKTLPIQRSWSFQMLAIMRCLIQNLVVRPRKLCNRSSATFEGNDDVVRIERYIARLHGLLQRRRTYAATVRAISSRHWLSGAVDKSMSSQH